MNNGYFVWRQLDIFDIKNLLHKNYCILDEMEKEEWLLDWEIRGFYVYAEKSFLKN